MQFQQGTWRPSLFSTTFAQNVPAQQVWFKGGYNIYIYIFFLRVQVAIEQWLRECYMRECYMRECSMRECYMHECKQVGSVWPLFSLHPQSSQLLM